VRCFGTNCYTLPLPFTFKTVTREHMSCVQTEEVFNVIGGYFSS